MFKVLRRHKLLQDKVVILFIASFPFSSSFHPFFICISQDWLSDISLVLRLAWGLPLEEAMLSYLLLRIVFWATLFNEWGTTSPTALARTTVASLLCTPPFFPRTLETLPASNHPLSRHLHQPSHSGYEASRRQTEVIGTTYLTVSCCPTSPNSLPIQ